ncbi:hypothetical protein, partial [Mammaliicoccus sciuri]|uniref:hypothetical protein n=1 Tax=Mammaliicoccus sciuri TaxID=1296 RepID=UPI003F5590DD
FESEFESKSEVLSVPELEPLLVSEPESLSDWLSELLSELEPESLFESESLSEFESFGVEISGLPSPSLSVGLSDLGLDSSLFGM